MSAIVGPFIPKVGYLAFLLLAIYVVYAFFMQRRLYGQGVVMTALKSLVLNIAMTIGEVTVALFAVGQATAFLNR